MNSAEGTALVVGGLALGLGALWLLKRAPAQEAEPRVPPVPPLGSPEPEPAPPVAEPPMTPPLGAMTLIVSTNDPSNIRLTVVGDWATRRNAVLRARARSSLDGHITPGADAPVGSGRLLEMSVAEFRRTAPVPPRPGTPLYIKYSLIPPAEPKERFGLVRNEIAREMAAKGWAIRIDPDAWASDPSMQNT